MVGKGALSFLSLNFIDRLTHFGEIDDLLSNPRLLLYSPYWNVFYTGRIYRPITRAGGGLLTN